MTKIITVIACILIVSSSFAQTIPTGINYQAAARNNQGEIIPNTEITAEINLFSGPDADLLQYREIHYVTGNDFGVFNLTIGEGISTNDGLTSDFTAIDWLSNSYHLQVNADFGTNEFLNGMQDMGSYKILSVPYAFTAEHAVNADHVTGSIDMALEELSNVNITNPENMQVISWDAANSEWTVANPGAIPDIFLRTDGSTDLTGNWTINSNNINLEQGNLSINNGVLQAANITGNTGSTISEFSNDGTMADNSSTSVPTENAVKTYADNIALQTAWDHNTTDVFLRTEKNVGIGTTTPVDKFELNLGYGEGFLVRGNFGGTTPDLGAGTRMGFYPAKGAFRAGRVENNSTYWDNNYIGNYSAAFGYDGNANGDYSFSAGRENIASAHYSTAFGRNNQTLSNYSFAVGRDNTASSLYSITMGNNNMASGNSAVCLGQENIAKGNYSLASGFQTQTGADNGTGGLGAFSSGELTKAEGNSSLVSGKNNIAVGDFSVVSGENNYTSSSAVSSAVSGKDNTAQGRFASVSGTNLTAESYNEHTLGQFNYSFGGNSGLWDIDDSLFTIGNGTNVADKSNALIVLKNGNTGIHSGTALPAVAFQVGTNGDGSVARANVWDTFSDKRLKKNIVRIDSASQKLEQLNGYYFSWKKGKDKSRQIGVIAQEVNAVFPELVNTDKKGYLSVSYPQLTAVLIEANKAQQSDIQKLQKENTELKNRLSKLEEETKEIKEFIRAQANSKLLDE